MKNFTLLVFGATAFLVGLIWAAGTGEATQTSQTKTIYFADTVHINTEEQTESGSLETQQHEDRETFLKEVRKLSKAIYNIKNFYMEDVDTKEIVKSGIRGMMEDLDRFSVLMSKRSYDRLMESTSGKYEGLGMEIDSRGDYISVVTPMEGTPAYRVGLRPGDEIQEINSESTYNMTTTDAAQLMRGQAGTSVILTIMREGFAEPIDFEVERAVIELKSVNYYGVIDGTNIGYIRLSRFAEETSNELREAIAELNQMGIDGLIFDLRSNGGGLLSQAVETAELFVPEGSLIVYTQGTFTGSNKRHYSKNTPMMPDKPLVVLVNEGTASASEIVAGAIQDWDRGLIIGYPTYGKGLVQQIFDLDNEHEISLKLTISKYYVPSGRCIQKPETQQKQNHGDMAEVNPDSLAVDSMNISDREVFYTNNGRPVYGGGGILPDVELEDNAFLTPLEINLERGRHFFDYAVKYVNSNGKIAADFMASDEMVNEFKDFVKNKEFSYKTSLEISLEEMQEMITEDGKDDLYADAVTNFKNLIEEEKEADFDKSKDYIKKAIKREVISNVFGERGVYENIILKTDEAVTGALDLLLDKEAYKEAITKGHLAAKE